MPEQVSLCLLLYVRCPFLVSMTCGYEPDIRPGEVRGPKSEVRSRVRRLRTSDFGLRTPDPGLPLTPDFGPRTSDPGLRTSMSRFAVIDIGTNSVRLAV